MKRSDVEQFDWRGLVQNRRTKLTGLGNRYNGERLRLNEDSRKRMSILERKPEEQKASICMLLTVGSLFLLQKKLRWPEVAYSGRLQG